jgi:hypothetical protein
MLFTITVASSLLLVIVFSLLIYYSNAHFFVKAFTLPSVILSVAVFFYVQYYYAGAPIHSHPTNEFEYISHRIEDKGRTVYLWVWSKEFNDHRLYVFPYDRENAKDMAKAKQFTLNGFPVTASIEKKKDGKVKFKYKNSQSIRMQRIEKPQQN